MAEVSSTAHRAGFTSIVTERERQPNGRSLVNGTCLTGFGPAAIAERAAEVRGREYGQVGDLIDLRPPPATTTTSCLSLQLRWRSQYGSGSCKASPAPRRSG